MVVVVVLEAVAELEPAGVDAAEGAEVGGGPDVTMGTDCITADCNTD